MSRNSVQEQGDPYRALKCRTEDRKLWHPRPPSLDCTTSWATLPHPISPLTLHTTLPFSVHTLICGNSSSSGGDLSADDTGLCVAQYGWQLQPSLFTSSLQHPASIIFLIKNNNKKTHKTETSGWSSFRSSFPVSNSGICPRRNWCRQCILHKCSKSWLL